MTIRKIGPADICLWPEGFWCLHEDLGEYLSRDAGDDFEVVTPEDPRYQQLTEETQ